MKKFLFLVAATLLVASYSHAQYLPEKGAISTEVQFNPFDQDGKMFKLDGLKVRYFFTDNDAFRMKIGFGLKHDSFSVTDDSDKPEDGSTAPYYSYENAYKSTSGNVDFSLGYERHFSISKRLGAYVGASVGFNRHFASTDIDMTTTHHYYDNRRWRSEVTSLDEAKISNGTFTEIPEDVEADELPGKVDDRAYWEVKAALFAGADFYVYKGLYVGTEFGLGLSSSKLSKMKYKTNLSDESDNVEFETNDNSRSTKLGVYIEPVLRLGWTF